MNVDQHPFCRIALALSGGGTRAVGFHLGTLSYLDRVGLLEKVRILSTVSGGSAVGLGYAVYRKIRRELPRDPSRPGRSHQSITLMDRGVYDNQGVFSVLNILGLTYDSQHDRPTSPYAYNPSDPNLHGMIDGDRDRNTAGQGAANVDLFIVSDTPLRDFPIYEIAAKPARTGFLDPEKLKWIGGITLFLLTASTLFMGFAYFHQLLSDPARLGRWTNYIWDFFLYIIPLLMLLVSVGGAYFLSRRLKRYLGNLPAFVNNPDLPDKLWKYFKKRKFSDHRYFYLFFGQTSQERFAT